MGIRFDRLEKCYQANAKADPHRFDMFVFGQKFSSTFCGTTHCLAGNYAMAHPKEGLALLWGTESCANIIDLGSHATARDALCRHFGISARQAACLFYASKREGRNSLDYRLARLRAFIDKHKPSAPTIPSMGFHAPNALADARMVLDTI